jgi:NAD-dependent dihydropyrimidine dehydrogenase PreA subunit
MSSEINITLILMRNLSAVIHYFSGTGNTSRVAHRIEERFKRAGYSVRLSNVEKHGVRSDRSWTVADLHVFAFPVYGFAVPAIMQRYMISLPDGCLCDGSATKAAVIAVHGTLNLRNPLAMGYEGRASAQARSILKKKGYDVFLTDAVGYPANLTQLLNPPSPSDQSEVIDFADLKVDRIAEAILGCKRSIKRHSILAHILTGTLGLFFSTIGHRSGGKLYVAQDNCTGCAACVKACPAGAIRLVRKQPRWSWSCEACQRCINLCPEKAIQCSYPRAILVYGAIFLPYQTWLAKLIGLIPSGLAGWIAALMIWLIGYILTVFILDEIIFIMELNHMSRLLQISYTQGFRRYLAPGYNPLA